MNTPHHTWSDSPIHNELAAWELLKEARRERDEAREETKRTREFMDHGFAVAQAELTAVTEQRDEARETLAELRASVLDLSHPNIKMILSERDRLQKIVDEQCRVSSVCREYQEQRDRLMFSIKKIYNISLFDYNTMPEAARRLYHGVVLEIADKARKHLSSNTI